MPRSSRPYRDERADCLHPPINLGGWPRSRCWDLVNCRPQIRMPKIVALPQQRFAFLPRQGVAEAVAEIEVGRVSALMACPLASQDM